MPDEQPNTASREITIAGKVFSVSLPYSAGHVLTDAEARALNQTRCENIRNNLASAIKKMSEGGKSDAEMAAEVSKLDSTYVFSIREAQARVVDPLEKECIAIARAELNKRIQKEGGKVKDYDKEAYAAKIAKWAQHPSIVKAAKASIAARAKIDLGEPASEPSAA